MSTAAVALVWFTLSLAARYTHMSQPHHFTQLNHFTINTRLLYLTSGNCILTYTYSTVHRLRILFTEKKAKQKAYTEKCRIL